MATTERPYKPVPFLNWKGMRRWSAGRRAPTVCKLFTETKSTSSFTSKLASLATMVKLLRKATSSFLSPSSPSASSSSPPPPSLSVRASSAATKAPSPPLPEMLSAAQARGPMQRCTSYSSNNSMRVGAIAIANCLRRHSDAIAPAAARVTVPLSRFSIDSAHPYYPTSHLNNEENGVRPKIGRLGSCSHDKPNIISMGSPMVAKMKDTYAHFVHTAAQQSSTHHPLDLLVGNPFLTSLNPAPVSSILLRSTNHVFAPSSGLLNVSKARDLQLNDRIVFFL